jgi:predicted permease
MVNSILNGVVPVALLIVFGFGLGKLGVFNEAAPATLSKFIITIALPVDLFVAAITTPRSELSDVKYVAAIAVAFVGLYALTFAIGRGLFRHSTDASAVQALTVGYPDMAFIGLPILVATVGQTAGTLPVLVGNIVTSLVLVPVTVAVLASKTASTTDSRISLSRIVWSAIKPPLVWLPILGVVLAVAGVNQLPSVVNSTLSPLAKTAGGVALVTIGLVLSHQRVLINRDVATNAALKLVAMPLAMLGLVSAFGIDGDARRALLLLAVTPTATAAGMLSLQYRTYVREASPTILVTTVLSLIGYVIVQMLT